MEAPAALPAERITRELLAVLPYLNWLITQELRTHGTDETTQVQLRVLGVLRDAPLTLSALARKRRVSLQSASEQIQGLVERGWVIRKPDPQDRRQALLCITPEGRSQFESAYEQVVSALTLLLAQLPDDEGEQVFQAMAALRLFLAKHEASAETAPVELSE